MRHLRERTRWALALGMVAVIALPATASAAGKFYLSLGTSLSVGVQPDPAGIDRLTDDGYADQLHRLLRLKDRDLQLVKLGCPGETTQGMIDGEGSFCTYQLGSQLNEAVGFLQANRGRVKLVTLDIGSSDLQGCATPEGVIDEACVVAAFRSVSLNLPVILEALGNAAGPHTPIVAMNYYNPALALWLLGPLGELVARQSAVLAGEFNDLLEGLYAAFGIPVADVARAFHSDDFRIVPLIGLPVNVIAICQWTWACTPPPQGPNVHANTTGYFVIALSFAAVLR